jgi:cation diffusion facilitator family transporter
VNLALVGAKAGVYWLTGSLAVGSEAVNSLADAVYSLVALGGLYLTTQPPDFEHPHGHERIEPFISLFVALGVFIAGGLIIWQAGQTVLSGAVSVSGGPPAVAVLSMTGLIKYGLFRYVRTVGRRFHSPALHATAIDNRNDIFTAGAALLGVLGAAAGYPILDPIAAGIVAVGVIYTGVNIVTDNVGYLVGAAPPEDLRTSIVERALSHPDVQGAHEIVAHYVGPEVDVSLHIEVEGTRTLLEAHTIETRVVESIGELPGIDDVFVHIDPREAGEWKPDSEVDRISGDQPHSMDENT